MKRAPAVVRVLALLLVAACTDAPSATSSITGPGVATQVTGDYIVTNSNDAGPGSFRDAITQANASVASVTIAFEPSVNTISLQSTITYSGAQDLTIIGNHSTLDASSAGGTGFSAIGGGNLSVSGFAVRGSDAEGIHVEVPAGATGTVSVSLVDVDITDNAGHGVLINDQTGNSGASLAVTVRDSRFLRNGNTPGVSVSDRDGLRVNEGGDGDIAFVFANSRAEDNGADGIELDETGAGNVVIDVSGARLIGNGPFDQADLDDGFDIDEANDGNVSGTVVNSIVNHNFEQGLDFNENDNGDLTVNLTNVVASFNNGEGIDYEEDDASGSSGDIVCTMTGVTTNGNGAAGDAGLKIRERGNGLVNVTLTDITSNGNATSGIQVREASGGNNTVSILNAVASGNAAGTGPGHGIDLLESGGGNLTATVTRSTVSANAGIAVFGDEAGGAVTLNKVKGNGNSAPTGGNATFTINP